jgi:hypothetical protein
MDALARLPQPVQRLIPDRRSGVCFRLQGRNRSLLASNPCDPRTLFSAVKVARAWSCARLRMRTLTSTCLDAVEWKIKFLLCVEGVKLSVHAFFTLYQLELCSTSRSGRFTPGQSALSTVWIEGRVKKRPGVYRQSNPGRPACSQSSYWLS